MPLEPDDHAERVWRRLTKSCRALKASPGSVAGELDRLIADLRRIREHIDPPAKTHRRQGPTPLSDAS